MICADIPQNTYGLAEFGTYFSSGDEDDLRRQLQFSLDNPAAMQERAGLAAQRVTHEFSWDTVVDQHVAIFAGLARDDDPANVASRPLKT